MVSTYTLDNGLLGLPPSFRHWQQRCHSQGIPPVIAVAGSRGKSTVVRLLQAIFNEAHVQSAIWTDFGVEINGRRQRREIAGWNLALSRLTEASLDVAVQEMDWSLVAAVGLPDTTYPIGVITNLCVNNTQCLETPDGHVAQRALPRVARAVHPSGTLCLNGEDYTLQHAANATTGQVSVAARSVLSPLLRQNVGVQGMNVWVDDTDQIVCGFDVERVPLCNVGDVPLTHGGTASFEVSNILLSVSAALATGIGVELVRNALTSFDHSTDDLPGSFNVENKGSVRAVVDRVMPSWFLKPVLRAANPRSARRQISVIGNLTSLPVDDVHEVGRLLGRTHGAVIHFGEADDHVVNAFKRGISWNEFPPVFVHLPTERRAINKAMRAVRADDVVLFLTHGDPGPALRAVSRMRGT